MPKAEESLDDLLDSLRWIYRHPFIPTQKQLVALAAKTEKIYRTYYDNSDAEMHLSKLPLWIQEEIKSRDADQDNE
jgi:hypothetical protein